MSILKTPWSQYYERIKAEKDPRDGSDVFTKRLTVIRGVRELFARNQHFQEMDTLGRQKIAGLVTADKIDFGWFGSMVGAGRFKQVIKNNDINLSLALDCIPAEGDISRADYLRYIQSFMQAFPNGGGGTATATRLLAMKRPDTFICLDSACTKKLRDTLGISRTIVLGNYWDLIIEQIKTATWWTAPVPSDDLEQEVWEARAAFFDSLCYDHTGAPCPDA